MMLCLLGNGRQGGGWRGAREAAGGQNTGLKVGTRSSGRRGRKRANGNLNRLFSFPCLFQKTQQHEILGRRGSAKRPRDGDVPGPRSGPGTITETGKDHGGGRPRSATRTADGRVRRSAKRPSGRLAEGAIARGNRGGQQIDVFTGRVEPAAELTRPSGARLAGRVAMPQVFTGPQTSTCRRRAHREASERKPDGGTPDLPLAIPARLAPVGRALRGRILDETNLENSRCPSLSACFFYRNHEVNSSG